MENNPFSTLSNEGLEKAGDVLGGGGGTIDSNVYTGEIKLLFAGKSDGGAHFAEVHIELEGGRMYRERLWVTNKEGKNFYHPKKAGVPDTTKKNPLPGYTTANDLALLSTGADLAAQEFEEKVVKLYDFDARAEVATKVQAATSMIGQKISIGVLKSIVDKNAKNETSGLYEPTGETREENTIDKVFHHETGKTVSEYVGKIEQAEFKDKWLTKNKDQVRNKAKGAEGKAGVPGRPSPAGGAAKAPTKSLFG